MGVYWLIAPEEVAPLAAQSHSRGVYDWSSLSMAGFHERDFASLWSIVRLASHDLEAATGEILARHLFEQTQVSRINPKFIQRLAEMNEVEVVRVAAEWLMGEKPWNLPKENAEELLAEIVSFAHSAITQASPVLQVTDNQ